VVEEVVVDLLLGLAQPLVAVVVTESA